MKALFFGATPRQLFGAYHAPAGDRKARDTAVVLLYPWIAEYNMSHWAFRKLATSLSREGFPTFRFDYYGTGDSMGTPGEASMSSGLEDIRQAVDEVRDLSGARAVSLVGMRLGASLAVQASERIRVRDLVLWDPVLRGESYLRELAQLDAGQREWRLYPPRKPNDATDELLGYALPTAARDELMRLELAAHVPRVSGRVHIVAGTPRPEYGQFNAALSTAGVRSELEIVEEETDGSSAAEGTTAIFCSKSLMAITAALAGSTKS